MLKETLTFRFQEDGAGKVKGAVEGVGEATEKVGREATDAAQAMRRAFKRVEAGLGSITRTAGSAASAVGKGMSAAASAAAGATAAIGAMAAGLVKLGAEGQRIAALEQGFKALGGTSKELEKLRKATDGLVPDAELMKIRNMAKSFGIQQENLEGFIALAKGATASLGTDFAQNLDDVITAAGRGSVEIFDNLGVQIGKLEDSYAAFAKKSGIAVKDLTSEQKNLAVQQMALAKGADLMAVGAQVQASEYARASTSMQNFLAEIQKLANEIIMNSGLFDTFNGALADVSRLFDENKEGIRAFSMEMMSVLKQVFGKVKETFVELEPELKKMWQWFVAMKPAMMLVVEVFLKVFEIAVKLSNEALKPIITALSNLIGFLAKTARALGMDELAGKLQSAADGMDIFTMGVDGATRSTINFWNATKKVDTEPLLLAFAGQRFEYAGKRVGDLTGEIANLGAWMIDTTEAHVALTQHTNETGESWQRLTFGIREATSAGMDWARVALGMVADGPEKKKPDKDAAKRAEARRELIYEASLIGMTEVQREVADINKQLTDNLKTAGKNAEAITAAHQIAASQVAPLLAREFAIAGEISAQRFAEKFDNTLSEWADRRASSLMRQIFSVDAIQGAIAEGMAGLDAGASFLGENFFTDSQMALAVFAEVIPNALAPLSEKIAATRTEFDALLGAFDGEATSGAMAGMLAFADGIEVMSMAVSDNLGTIGSSFREMAEAAKLGDTTEATEKSFAALGKATQGAVAIGKAGANHFIKDKKKLAGVLGGFEIAEALGAAARLDFLGAAAHTLASIKYFAVAGGGAGAQTGSTTRQRAQRQRTQLTRGNDAVLDRRNTGPSQVNNYFFSMLDQRAPGEAVMDALGRAAQNGSRAGIPGRLVSDGNIQRGL